MKKILLVIIILIAALWIFSVLHKSQAEKNWDNSQRVTIGMTTSEIESIMGKPREIDDEYICPFPHKYGYRYDNVFGSSDDILFCFDSENKVSGIETE